MNSQKKISPLTLLLIFLPILFTLFGITFRIINITNFYDSYIGYYQKAVLPVVMNVFFVLSIPAFIVLCLFAERKNHFSENFAVPTFLKVICSICSVSTLVSALNFLINGDAELKTLLIILASVCSALFFGIFLLKTQTKLKALLALFPIALNVIILAVTYLDVTVEMNSPNKMLIHFACIACMLGFLAEARLFADDKKRRSYYFFIITALFFSGISSIPSVILYFSNSFDYSYIEYDCILLVFFVYFIARMVSVCLDGHIQKNEITTTDDITAL